MRYAPKIAKRLEAVVHASSREHTSSGVDANFDCGCFIRFGVSLDPVEHKVKSAGFNSNGCGYMVAAAEVAAEAIEDLSLADLRGSCSAAVQRRLVEALGECPGSRKNCVAAVVNAAAAAFANRRTQLIAEFRGETPLVCTCFGVTEETVSKSIVNLNLRTVDEIGDATNAGTGCGSCQMLLRELLDEPRDRTGTLT